MTVNHLPGAIAARIVYRPELRITPTGHSIATFTVATSQRRKVGDSWQDGPATFVRVTAWRQLAENLVESDLRPGDLVTLSGELELKEWEAADGTKRRDLELTARTIAVDVTRAPVTLRRVERAAQSSADPDPWPTSPDAGGAVPPW
jgi:single-strand DNA-binding protein